jgi:hypothetical protein
LKVAGARRKSLNRLKAEPIDWCLNLVESLDAAQMSSNGKNGDGDLD